MARCTGPPLALLLLLFHSHSLDGAKILLIPEDHGGHVNMMLVTGQNLVDVGHEVYVLTSDRHRHLFKGSNVSGILVKTVEGFQRTYAEVEELLIFGGLAENRRAAALLTPVFTDQCRAALEDRQTMETLYSIGFDLVLVDGFDPSRCMYIIPYKLGVKYITFAAGTHPWGVRIPSLPSVETPLLLVHLKEDSSFWERVTSLAAFVGLSMALPAVPDDLIDKYAPELPKTTFRELFLKSEMWLVNQNNICLNGPMVYAPHYQFVAGINTRPAKPLPPDLEDFARKAGDGLVVFTLGSFIKRVPSGIMDKFMAAFRRMRYSVVMRFDGDMNVDSVPANVKISRWLPQNDLLGHPNTRLFISHVGNNGQLEAVYHGVPMLAAPLFSDQPYNAQRSEHRGYGKTIDILNFTVDELVDKIIEIIENGTYRENIRQCSKVYHDFPSPHRTVQFYVDHVLKFGGSHLKPASLHMPLWKFFMLDILVFFLAVLTVIMILMMLFCLVIYRRCSKSRAQSGSKSKTE